MTERVVIFVYGQKCEVDSDQVKMHMKKSALVDSSMESQRQSRGRQMTFEESKILNENAKKIISLNRRIRKTTSFPK